MHDWIPLYWEILILMVGNFRMLRVSVCYCSFQFYPPVGVSPCVWCRSVLCCVVLFVCAAGSVTVLTVGCFYTVNWVSCLLCEAGSFTVLWLFTAWHFYCWLELHCVLPFLYSKRTVLFTVCAYWLVAAVWWCLLHCCILPLFVCSFLVGKRFPVVLSWDGSLCVRWLVGVLVGLGLFCGYCRFREARKILLGAMLDSSFKWW